MQKLATANAETQSKEVRRGSATKMLIIFSMLLWRGATGLTDSSASADPVPVFSGGLPERNSKLGQLREENREMPVPLLPALGDARRAPQLRATTDSSRDRRTWDAGKSAGEAGHS